MKYKLLANTSGKSIPTAVSYAVSKKPCLYFLFVLSICGSFFSSAQTTVPGGMVSGTWTLANSPYQVTGSIQIPNDSTLTIQPGVTVEFQGHFKLVVLGRLLAMGTATDSITFSAANTTTGWRGLRFPNTTTNNDSSKIMYCKFLYGKATASAPDNNGGALYIDSYSKILFSRNRVANCSANNSGGGIYLSYCNPVITYNKIVNNTSLGSLFFTTGGGGIFQYLAPTGLPTNISFNLISNNSASSYGGAIYARQSAPSISNNIITNNTAINGGAVYSDGTNSMSQNAVITNNTIANNSATSGGGLYCGFDSDPTVRNTILYGNTATNGAQVFLNDEPSDPNFYYSDVQGGSAAIDANGNFFTGTYSNNINSNPMFVSPSAGSGTGFNGLAADWSLTSPGSPCIDAGDPTTLTPATDFFGMPRVNICRIDMGAIEYQTGVPFALSVSQISSVLCNGDATASLLATASGSGTPYSYLWSGSGSTNDTLANVSSGTYTVQATNTTGCVATATLTVVEPSAINLFMSGSNVTCSPLNCDGAFSVFVSGGTPPYQYVWSSSPNDTLSSTPANLCIGTYSVTITDDFGCTKTQVDSVVFAPNIPSTPEICMVTVDTVLADHNIVIWEKTLWDTLSLDSVFIYKDTAVNAYKKMGAVAITASGQFHDSPTLSDPNFTDWRYKIAVLDTCGNLSGLSDYHKTIWTQQAPPGTFSIGGGGYDVENWPGFVPNYALMRDDLGTGVWNQVGPLVPGNAAGVSDPSYASFPNAKWRIESVGVPECDPGARYGTTPELMAKTNKSRSNLLAPPPTLGINATASQTSFSIFPNPSNGNFTMQINSEKSENAKIEIVNLLGEIVYTENYSCKKGENKIQLNMNLASGVYFVRLMGEKVNGKKKLVIE